eukprot:3023116-Karenia_brevis.AAC.1
MAQLPTKGQVSQTVCGWVGSFPHHKAKDAWAYGKPSVLISLDKSWITAVLIFKPPIIQPPA